MLKELKGLHSSSIHVAHIYKLTQPENDRELSMLHAAFNSVAGIEDGSDTPQKQ
jgi:hypothetical protein